MSKKFILALIFALSAIVSVNAEEDTSYKNAIVAEFLFAEGNYDISGPGIDYKFSSDFASRFKFSYLRRLNERFVLFGTFSTYEITVLNTTDNSNRQSKMGGYEVGTRYYISQRWSATVSAESKKEIFFEDQNGIINGVVDWTKRLNGGLYMKAFEKGDFAIVPSLRVGFILPSGDQKIGTSYTLNSNFNYFFPKVRASLGVGYEARNQKYKTIKLTESGLQFAFGAGYSF